MLLSGKTCNSSFVPLEHRADTWRMLLSFTLALETLTAITTHTSDDHNWTVAWLEFLCKLESRDKSRFSFIKQSIRSALIKLPPALSSQPDCWLTVRLSPSVDLGQQLRVRLESFQYVLCHCCGQFGECECVETMQMLIWFTNREKSAEKQICNFSISPVRFHHWVCQWTFSGLRGLSKSYKSCMQLARLSPSHVIVASSFKLQTSWSTVILRLTLDASPLRASSLVSSHRH